MALFWQEWERANTGPGERVVSVQSLPSYGRPLADLREVEARCQELAGEVTRQARDIAWLEQQCRVYERRIASMVVANHRLAVENRAVQRARWVAVGCVALVLVGWLVLGVR